MRIRTSGAPAQETRTAPRGYGFETDTTVAMHVEYTMPDLRFDEVPIVALTAKGWPVADLERSLVPVRFRATIRPNARTVDRSTIEFLSWTVQPHTTIAVDELPGRTDLVGQWCLVADDIFAKAPNTGALETLARVDAHDTMRPAEDSLIRSEFRLLLAGGRDTGLLVDPEATLHFFDPAAIDERLGAAQRDTAAWTERIEAQRRQERLEQWSVPEVPDYGAYTS